MEPGAPRMAAKARVVPPLAELETVIESELFTGCDVTAGHNPDPPAPHFHATIRCARVIDQTRDIAPDAAVEIVAGVEFEDIHAIVLPPIPSREPLPLPLRRFGFRDAFARVFDDARAIRDRTTRVDAAPMNRRAAGNDPNRRSEPCVLGSSMDGGIGLVREQGAMTPNGMIFRCSATFDRYLTTYNSNKAVPADSPAPLTATV